MVLSRLLVALLCLALVGCAPSAQPPHDDPAPREIRLGEEDDGDTIELAVGGTLEVVLAANPTTGYGWEVASKDTLVLMQVGEPSFEAAGGALGAGGKTTLRFVALAPGETVLRLVYRRPFEEGTPPARRFEVTVRVR